MSLYLLDFSPEIIKAEEAYNMAEATEIAYTQWKAQPMDRNLLLCAGTELWYSQVQSDYYIFDPSVIFGDETLRLERLMKVTRWMFRYFANDAVCNAYFGYLIKVMPYFFNDFGGDADGWREKGRNMMKKAYRLDPENLLAKVMYYEALDDFPRFEAACTELWKRETPESWGKSAVQEYFFSILSGFRAYPEWEG